MMKKSHRQLATMTALKLVVLLLLGLVALSLCAPQLKVRRNMLRGRPVGGLVKKPLSNVRSVRPARADTFTNKVDHFGNNTATFSQRYWYNDEWYKPGGPVFFMLGGESAESAGWVESADLEWTQMAAQQGAYVFLMEHRFYGNSRPTSDMSTNNLQYLSSAQAIEDFAAFIRGMKVKFPQLVSAPWVTFGGSYSGALSAWMRVKHPELVAIAVGSSGPVQAEVDFSEYLEVVENSISRSSNSCAASVAAGFKQVASLLQTAGGRATLKNTFSLCENLDISNSLQIKTFWETIYSPYMEIVQYSGDQAGQFATSLTVDHAICRFHNSQSTSTLNKMKEVNNYFNQVNFYFGCNDIDYNGFIQFMQDTSYGDAQDSRAWVWQTCTEFGYYQSTDSNTAGPFFGGKTSLPVGFYIDECTAIYGQQYNSASIAASVAQTNKYYGGRDNMMATNVVLPNGNVDPWHALGKLNSSQASILPVVIDGTAHCADMYGSSAKDLPSLTAARQTIRTTVANWLTALN